MQTIFTFDYEKSFNVRLVADNHQPENNFYEYFLYIGENKYNLVCKRGFFEKTLVLNKKDSHRIFINLFDDAFIDYTVDGEDRYLSTLKPSALSAIEKECDLLDIETLTRAEFIKTLLKATPLTTSHFI